MIDLRICSIIKSLPCVLYFPGCPCCSTFIPWRLILILSKIAALVLASKATVELHFCQINLKFNTNLIDLRKIRSRQDRSNVTYPLLPTFRILIDLYSNSSKSIQSLNIYACKKTCTSAGFFVFNQHMASNHHPLQGDCPHCFQDHYLMLYVDDLLSLESSRLPTYSYSAGAVNERLPNSASSM